MRKCTRIVVGLWQQQLEEAMLANRHIAVVRAVLTRRLSIVDEEPDDLIRIIGKEF